MRTTGTLRSLSRRVDCVGRLWESSARGIWSSSWWAVGEVQVGWVSPPKTRTRVGRCLRVPLRNCYRCGRCKRLYSGVLVSKVVVSTYQILPGYHLGKASGVNSKVRISRHSKNWCSFCFYFYFCFCFCFCFCFYAAARTRPIKECRMHGMVHIHNCLVTLRFPTFRGHHLTLFLSLNTQPCQPVFVPKRQLSGGEVAGPLLTESVVLEFEPLSLHVTCAPPLKPVCDRHDRLFHLPQISCYCCYCYCFPFRFHDPPILRQAVRSRPSTSSAVHIHLPRFCISTLTLLPFVALVWFT